MSGTSSQSHFIPPPPGSDPLPPPAGCVRIATNQRGPIGSICVQPVTPGMTWTGGSSGATGKHVRYVYIQQA